MILAQTFLDSEELCSLNCGGGDTAMYRQLSKTDSKLIEASLRKELTQQLKSLKSLSDDDSSSPFFQ